MTDRPTQDDSPLTEESFLTARFAGGRFDAHAIPFDVLPDLAAYRGLIVEVAKMLFKKRHNDRVRVPKGFGDSFQIGLKRVVGGHSAVVTGVRLPQLKADVQGDLGFAHYPEFDDAKAYVDALIRKVANSGEVPETFRRSWPDASTHSAKASGQMSTSSLAMTRQIRFGTTHSFASALFYLASKPMRMQ